MRSLVTGVEIDNQERAAGIDAGEALCQATKYVIKLKCHRFLLITTKSIDITRVNLTMRPHFSVVNRRDTGADGLIFGVRILVPTMIATVRLHPLEKDAVDS